MEPMTPSRPASRTGDGPPVVARRATGDFTADRRILLLAGMALVVGSGAVLAAWILVSLIGLVTNLVWFGQLGTTLPSLAGAPPGPWMVLAPALGGLVIGLMARYGSDKIRGHGIPEALEAILIGGSRMSPKVAVLKPVSSAVSIGTGGPFGAEGPIIMTGGAVGSLFAQAFHLSDTERKTLLVAGSAAGMTAIFGTPVAALLLAVELLLFEWRPRSLVPVAASVMVAAIWRPLAFEAGPLFPVAAGGALPGWGLAAAAGLGLAMGLLSGLVTALLYRLEDLFEHLPLHWMWWPALGGLAVGLAGLVEPRALGVGYDVIADLVGGHPLAGAVATILAVKAVIWLVALASGTSGGVLAPLLILGGGAGWLIGLVLPGPQGLWALVGMAAMLGGSLRAPLTGALFAVEVSGDLAALPAVLAGSVAAYALTVLLLKRSILTERLARRGRHVSCEYGADPHALIPVAQVMTRAVETIPAGATIGAALAALESGSHHAYPVVEADERPAGLVTRADALLWASEGADPDGPLRGQLAGDALPALYPDDPVAAALDLMLAAGRGRLAVIDPGSGALVGLLTRRDLLRVRAATLRGEEERRAYIMRRSRVPRRTGAGA